MLFIHAPVPRHVDDKTKVKERTNVLHTIVHECVPFKPAKCVFVQSTDLPFATGTVERMIKRSDRQLTPTAVVCEKHFEEGCIEHFFKVTVNVVVNEIVREKPRMKTTAVPAVFESYPKHLCPKSHRRERSEVIANKAQLRNATEETPSRRATKWTTTPQQTERQIRLMMSWEWKHEAKARLHVSHRT
ncbi:hypothetical protein HPB48_019911 [Haemaphysalis longicornis]|uniref:THAP-type domain-containing protein n=1 Tax=Haemaphysalis longicornis TaxID=44386 RepID=A0A9J6FTN3_HAELO|nr:hypothetical protein HPB48_019911 [Haemaphysalis longicornis]